MKFSYATLLDYPAEGVFSIGNFGLLSQDGLDWAQMKPLSRVKEPTT